MNNEFACHTYTVILLVVPKISSKKKGCAWLVENVPTLSFILSKTKDFWPKSKRFQEVFTAYYIFEKALFIIF